MKKSPIDSDNIIGGIIYVVLIALAGIVVFLSHVLYKYIVDDEEMFLTLLIAVIGLTIAITYNVTRRKYEKIISEMEKGKKSDDK